MMEITFEQMQALARLASYPDEGEPGSEEFDQDVETISGIETFYFLASLARPTYEQIRDDFPKKTECAALVLDQIALVDSNAETRANTSRQTVTTLRNDWEYDQRVLEWRDRFNLNDKSQFFEVVTDGLVDWMIKGLADRTKQLETDIGPVSLKTQLAKLSNLFVAENELTKHWPSKLRRAFNCSRYLQIEDPAEIGRLLSLDEKTIVGQLVTCSLLMQGA